ncbi:PIR protein CIR protein [Plasmodium vinckei brucechwatti]|uniref:PIR protein CIR protein n=1 Tax=Plasmodium vinckei brucechwatti TaxID=119398 RepID=A0A6V7RWA3_PLAVN|nr:PIR protein CIR protein [Plasmodium vinckei brucechwatti]
MADKACKFLRDADGYFNNGIVNEEKFNSSNLFTLRCPYDKINKTILPCKNNYERINALGGYLYQNLESIADNFKGKGNNANRHIEIFTMWLGDKLYKLEEKKIATLEEYYNNHLKAYMGVVDYWNLLDSKQGYKKANVWYMSELYSLLNYICNLITEYNKNPNSREIGKISPKCHQKFKTIYNDIRDCYSYFHLLKFLKNIYDGVRNAAVSAQKKPRGNRLLSYLMSSSTIPIVELTTIDWNKRFPDQSDQILDFHTNACVKLYSEFEKKQKDLELKKKQKAEPHTGNDKSGGKVDNKLPENSKLKKDAPTKQVEKPTALKQKGRQPQRRKGVRRPKPKVEQSPAAAQKQMQEPPPAPKPPAPQSVVSQPQPPPQQGPPQQGPPQQGPPQQVQQTTSPVLDPPEPAQDGSSSQTHQTGGTSSQNASKTSDNNKENTGGASGGNVNPGGGSNDPTSNMSGGSFDLWSPFRGFLLNGTEIYNKTFQFIKESQQRLNDAKDQISNAYDNAVNNLKSAYNTSSSYFSGIISNISSRFNQFGTPPKPGNLGNSTPQNNDQLQKNGGPSLPPTKGPPPKDPQPNSIPTTSKDPSQLPPQLPPQLPSSPTPQRPQPLNSIQQKKSSSQSQHITQNHPQISPPNHKTMVQLINSLSSNLNLKKSWNILPTTWNGSGNCKLEINFMNATLVCCTSEHCSLTGISVTLILIPIILLIAYKYLSREWTKKSEKKNMKRVIKLVDGNRKTKIIISSNDRNKDLKPVINSDGRKKDSLLNIYKLMQADPIPFINLFFLLIFFVYKRKSDFLEL